MIEKIREEWEKGLTVKYVIEQPTEYRVLVVLVDEKGLFHLHRYFEVGADFACSVDAQKVDLETVWRWLEDPKSLPKKD